MDEVARNKGDEGIHVIGFGGGMFMPSRKSMSMAAEVYQVAKQNDLSDELRADTSPVGTVVKLMLAGFTLLFLLPSVASAQFDNLESVTAEINSYELPPIDDSSSAIVLQAGQYNVRETIDLTKRHLSCNGIVELCSTGDHAVLRMTANGKQRRHQDAINDGKSDIGARVSGVTIRGVNKGIGILVEGTSPGVVTDEIRIDGVSIFNMDVGIRCVGPVRESHITNCNVTNCRTLVEIIDNELPIRDGLPVPSDGTNNLWFTDCKLLYPRQYAVHIVDDCSSENIRCIAFKGGLIHCRTLWDGMTPEPAVLVEGRKGEIRYVTLRPDRWVGPGPTAPVIRLQGKVTDVLISGFWEKQKGTQFVSADPGCKFRVVE